MSRRILLLALGAAVFAAPAFGQLLTATVTPNPAPIGTPITIAIADRFGLGLQTPSSCVLASVRSGTPGGPVVAGFFCLTVITPIPACSSGNFRTQSWNQTSSGGAQQPAGLYWFEVQFWDAGFLNLRTEWFCVTITDPTQPGPALTPAGGNPVATLGQPFTMTLSSPADPGAPYFTALSGTTNAGFPLGSGYICLDPDPIFFLSFPNPLPGILAGFQGNLDLAGSSPPIVVNVPNIPSLSCVGLHAQAVVIPSPSQVPSPTNDVAFRIQ